MSMDATYKECGSDWPQQVSAVLQHKQTLPLSVKGVACETMKGPDLPLLHTQDLPGHFNQKLKFKKDWKKGYVLCMHRKEPYTYP